MVASINRPAGLRLTAIDQAASSASNFVCGLLAARLLGPGEFGVFAFFFAAYVTLQSLSRSLITQPAIILSRRNGSQDAAAGAPFPIGKASALFLGFLMVSSFATSLAFDDQSGSRHLSSWGQAAIILIGAAPILVLHDLFRLSLLARGLGKLALAGDLLWLLVGPIAMLVSSLLLEDFLAGAALFSWAVGGAAGFALLFVGSYRQHSSGGSPIHWRQVLKLGSSLSTAEAIFHATTNTTNVLIAGGLGASALGGIKAPQQLLSPLSLLSMTSETWLLPRTATWETSRSISMATRAAVVLFVLILAPGLLVWHFSSLVIPLILGSAYLEYVHIFLPVAVGLALGAAGVPVQTLAKGLSRTSSLIRAQAVLSVCRVGLVLAAIPSGLYAVAWVLAGTSIIAPVWIFAELRVTARVKA
jgi:O-antigen/teichoic acid export membrane protein